MNSPTRSSVGPKPSSRFAISDRPCSVDFAFTVTFFDWRRAESWSVLANVGTSVLKNFEDFVSLPVGGYFTLARNSPWTVEPFDEIDLTLPALICWMKVGV